MRVCPVCKREYEEYPALSRKDNRTEICPDCGMAEALESFGLSKLEAMEKVVRIKEATKKAQIRISRVEEKRLGIFSV